MKVVLASTAGFCIGVKRALEMVLKAINESQTKIYTYGPLIHNPQVLELLKERGITVLQPGESAAEGLVVIRAHGIPPQERRQLEGRAARIIDATCPRVAKVQAIIRRWAAKGHATLIVGDVDHPEVSGLLGHTEGRGHVVVSAEDVAALPELGDPIVVAQTTQSEALFEARVAEIKARFPGARIFNTICDATASRQAEVQELASRAEALVVVGGRNSGNTQRLVEISRATGIPTYHVETEQELDLEEMSRYHTVGVTAGASTPHWLISNVVSTLKHAWAFRPGSWTNYIYRAWRFSLKSNLYVATGAGSLSYVSSLLQQVEPQFTYFFVAFFYVYAMHLLNHFTDKASKLNDPVQSLFYGKHRQFLLCTGAISAGLALALGAYLGWLPFVFILVMSGIGLLYNFKIIPDSVSRVTLISTLKEIPGSKSVFTAVAWGVLAALIPVVCSDQEVSGATAIAFFFVAGMIFIRSGLFEIMAIEGDRVVGKETLAIALGRERTLNVLSVCSLAFSAMLLLAAWAGVIPSLGYIMSVSGLYALGYLAIYRRGLLESGLMLESLVEGNMVLAGILAFLWDPYNTVASFWFLVFG
ncbi:MAG: 4-hydroxy-3-methylbut-2-enyl diphosphate reductase [Deltaproteobacteria bacterium]|nr:4-hydroxy-3-methylbut-2-enyl diphosphate reductase [Deltaproteobacteria bacterium]